MSLPDRDDGVTLIEILVTISLLGAMMIIAVSGWASWARASEQAGTARELQSVMRQTQQRAVTEGTSMCVTFANSSYTVWRGSCVPSSTRTRAEGPVQVGRGVQINSVGVPDGVTFTARGTSTGGSTVTVTRSGSSKVYTLLIEGFTGRVSLA